MTPRRPRFAPLPPPGLRPKLSGAQVCELGLAHLANLEAISRGAADETVLWQWVAGALTWSHVADALQRRAPEECRAAAESMRVQLEVAESVLERYGRTGRVGFSGPEYQQAKEACEWMDAMALVVDQATASAAADFSERQVNQMIARQARKGRQAAWAEK